MPVFTGHRFEAEIFPDRESMESHTGVVPEHVMLELIRTDGETFVDAEIYGNDGPEGVCRLLVSGNETVGWRINGLPAGEVIEHQGWMEE